MKLQTFTYTIFILLSFILLIFLITVSVKANNISSNFNFSTGFENRQNIGWKKEICNACPHSINIVDSHSRSGVYSARFEINKSDPDSISGRKRAELARKITEPGTDRERWYGVSIFLPNDYDYDPEAEIVTQWHATPDKNATGRIENWRSPPLALLTSEGKWQIDWRWDKNKITHGEPKRKYKNLGTYARGQWTDWAFYVKWSHTNNGQLEVWKNGQKVLSYKGPIGYNDKQGVYMKVGLYKWVWNQNNHFKSLTNRRVIFVDNIYTSTTNITNEAQ